MTILPRSDPRIIKGGVVEYEGTIVGHSLKLRWRSHLTNTTGRETFTFIPLTLS